METKPMTIQEAYKKGVDDCLMGREISPPTGPTGPTRDDVLDAIYDRVVAALANGGDSDVMALTDICNIIEGAKSQVRAEVKT